MPLDPQGQAAPCVTELSAVDLADLIWSREVGPREVLAEVVDRIERFEPQVHAVITLATEQAMAAATSMERSRPQRRPPLWGVPVTVKDLTPTAGIPTTRGCALRSRWAPDVDAIAVERLRAAGAVIVAKTNTSEEGWKAETSNRLGPSTLNPWDLASSAGGSSGGAGAAVACGFGPIATGTDGAGSVRVPASFCGVVGFKPTFGAIPYWPPSAEGLSHLGPLARTVGDIALAMEVLAGADVRDPGSDIDLLASEGPGDALRIGVVRAAADWATDPAVSRVLDETAGRCSDLGLRLTEAPDLPPSYETLEVILSAFEAGPYAAGGLEVDAPDLDPGRVAVIERGLYLSAAQLAAAVARRQQVAVEIGRLWTSFDLLLMPTTPVRGFAPGGCGPDTSLDVIDRLRWACFSYPWNLTGDPACSLPATGTGDRPVGVQLVGPCGHDRRVLGVARRLEAAGVIGTTWPPLLHPSPARKHPSPASGPNETLPEIGDNHG